MKFTVFVEPDDNGFCARVRHLPGCFLWTPYKYEVQALIRPAIKLYLRTGGQDTRVGMYGYELSIETRVTADTPSLYFLHEQIAPFLLQYGFEMAAEQDWLQAWKHPVTRRRVIVAYHYGSYFPPKTTRLILEEVGLSESEIATLGLVTTSMPRPDRRKSDRLEECRDPYEINEEIQIRAEKIASDFSSQSTLVVHSISSRIFSWVKQSITYGDTGLLGYGVGIRTALDTYNQGQGQCAEMSFLFLAMCRHVGLECYPIVTGQERDAPNHMLAGVITEEDLILYDPAKRHYECPYPRLWVWGDEYLTYQFNLWRGTNRFNFSPPPQGSDERALELTRLFQSSLNLAAVERGRKQGRNDNMIGDYSHCDPPSRRLRILCGV